MEGEIVGGYSVDADELRQCSGTLADLLSQCRAAVAAVRFDASELLGVGWQGSAASAFRVGWEQWLAGVTAMLGALDQIASAIESSGIGYTTSDEAVRTSLVRGMP